MTYRTYEIDGFALPLPIATTARETAIAFAREQPTPQKAEQVCLNTLAVFVVDSYLRMMGIATDLAASGSWNRMTRLFADIADLEVTGLGRLECRPVRVQAQVCLIPPEVWADRIGYVVVEIEAPFQEAKILGFVPTAAVEALPLSQLRSPEALLDHLALLRQAVAVPTIAHPVVKERVNLSQWLDNIFEAGWQTVESLLNRSELSPGFAFRNLDSAAPQDQTSGVRRVKRLDLGQEGAIDLAATGNRSLLLVTEIQTETIPASSGAPQIQILLQVHPYNQTLLPQGLRLIVRDESGTVFLEAESRSVDNYIQLQFSGSPGEAFNVEIRSGAARAVEEFVI